MKIAIIAGKCDGCGVSTYLFELQKAINKYIGICDYFVYDCPSFFKQKDYDLMKLLNVNLITKDKANILNDYDIVFAGYHVVRSQVTEEEARGYYDMLEYDITKPKKVIIFNEHRPSSIIRHYAGNTINDYCLKPSFLLSFDYIMQFGENITSAVFLKDLIGDYEYSKRFIPLYLLYEFSDKSNWIKAENKIKAIEYLGRPVLFKDSHRLVRMNKYIQSIGFISEMRGLGMKETVENLPDFVYKGIGNNVDKNTLSDVTYWVDSNEDPYKLLNLSFEDRHNKIYCYGSYNRYEIYKHLNRVMFACDFFNLPHTEDYAEQTMEYCMCEFIDNGIIPVLDKGFGENCKLLKNAKLTNNRFLDIPTGLYVSKDLSNIDDITYAMDYLANNPNEYEEFRNNCFACWKEHCNPEAIIKDIIYRIYA